MLFISSIIDYLSKNQFFEKSFRWILQTISTKCPEHVLEKDVLR